VRRWLASSASRRAVASAAVVAAGLGVGIAAEQAVFAWDDPLHWVPDLLVGLAFAGAGAYALWRRRPGTGLLFAATGFTWFAGTAAASLLYLHRGPLVHTVIAYPGWRPRSRLALATIAVGWVAAVVTPVWRSEPVSLGLGLGLVVVGVVDYLRSPRVRADRIVALWGTLALGGTLAVGAAVRLAVPSGDAVEPLLLAYEAVLCGLAVGLAAHLRAPAASTVADLVVELGDSRSGTLRDALAAALGDPTLEVGYWRPTGTYVDAAGATVAVPPPTPGRPPWFPSRLVRSRWSDSERARHGAAGPADVRTATFVERDARPFAVLVHDPSVLDEPALVEAVATATRLAAANAALQGDVQAHLADLTASRRRLLLAGDEERQRLEAQLRNGVERRLTRLAEALRDAAGDVSADPRSAGGEHLRRAQQHLDSTLVDLQSLAQGLHPGDLRQGLNGALAALAGRSPVPVDLTVPVGDVFDDEPAAVAAYFVCAEALANVMKHADADHVTVGVERMDGCVAVTVTDDGAGGADPAGGTGLRGLTDRVEAVGGTLRVDSPIGSGTRLVAELPLDHRSPR
jgi:signal transduction histidine kinase